MQFVALCQRLLCQLAPLLLQRAHPLLHGVLVGFIRFGHQILTSSQNPLVLGLLGLELRLQNLSMVDPNTTYQDNTFIDGYEFCDCDSRGRWQHMRHQV